MYVCVCIECFISAAADLYSTSNVDDMMLVMNAEVFILWFSILLIFFDNLSLFSFDG